MQSAQLAQCAAMRERNALSKITRKNTGLCGVSTSLESSVSHVSHGEQKEKVLDVEEKTTEQYCERMNEISWNLERKIQNIRWLSRDESLNLKDDICWKPINGQIKLSVRENTCVVNWR